MSPRRKAKIAAQINKQKHSECWKELKKEGENLRALQNRSTLVGEHKGSDGALLSSFSSSCGQFQYLTCIAVRYCTILVSCVPERTGYRAAKQVPQVGTATVVDQNSHACYGLQSREIKKSKDSIKSTEEN